MAQTALSFIKKYYPFFIALTLIIVLSLIFCLILLKESLPTPYEVKPGEFGAGEIGEASESKLPPTIFNTTGIIRTIQNNYLIAQGDGSNFADQQLRDLKVIFTDSTITFEPGQKKYYKGLDGLKYLKSGMKILIDGAENIRGKAEFQVRTINVLK